MLEFNLHVMYLAHFHFSMYMYVIATCVNFFTFGSDDIKSSKRHHSCNIFVVNFPFQIILTPKKNVFIFCFHCKL